MTSYFHWIYNWIYSKILAVPGRVIALLFFIGLLITPFITVNPSLLRTLSFASIFAIYAASWDLLAVTGQVSLGHALFFGCAGYAAALANIHFGLPPWASIPFGSLCAVIVGLFAGIPALRLRGFYLALVTLAFPVIVTGIIFAFPKFLGGDMGLTGIRRLSQSLVVIYYIAVLTMVFSSLIMWKLGDSRSKIIRTGVILHAIREDEIAARTSGINTIKYKLMVYAISGFFAGIAGGIYTHFIRVAGPSSFEILFSFQALLWAIFGGMGTIYGAITGVFTLFPFLEYIRTFGWGDEFRFIFMGLILIFFLLFMPEGISVWVLDKIQLKCQRCKVINFATSHSCRACRAPFYMTERKKKIE